MSIGFKQCEMCGDGVAEALYAVDGMIEYYCHECEMQWAEEPVAIQETSHERWMLHNYGEV